jgi:ribosomal protein S6
MQDNLLKTYEISFLVKNENGTASIVKQINLFNGSILSEGGVEHTKLAYPIGGEDSLYFGCIQCKLDKGSLDSINKALKLDTNIVRILITSPIARLESSMRQQKTIFGKRRERRETAKTTRPQQEISLSNELLEEKLEEILK